jgi:L-asparaginase/Glu-tRNA(Gln) amidotransferase subunit D
MSTSKFRRKSSFLLKLINENKELMEDFSSSSDESSNIISENHKFPSSHFLKKPRLNSHTSSEEEDKEKDLEKNNNNINKNQIISPNKNLTSFISNAYSVAKFNDVEETDLTNKKILIIYTGGTLGMEKSFDGLRPKANFLINYMYNHLNLCDKEYTHDQNKFKDFDIKNDFLITPETITGKRIYYKIEEFENLIDSSNMNLDYWKKIGRAINKSYYQYDSFIVIHGTDTMNYTASILSFMLENLNKLVLITGSQIPLIEMRNDAHKNLIDALIIAGTYEIPEVCLLFDSKLFRGNRTIKNDNINLDAFESPNLPPLVTIGINMKINYNIIKPKPIERFNYFEVNKNKLYFLPYPILSYFILFY